MAVAISTYRFLFVLLCRGDDAVALLPNVDAITSQVQCSKCYLLGVLNLYRGFCGIDVCQCKLLGQFHILETYLQEG